MKLLSAFTVERFHSMRSKSSSTMVSLTDPSFWSHRSNRLGAVAAKAVRPQSAGLRTQGMGQCSVGIDWCRFRLAAWAALSKS